MNPSEFGAWIDHHHLRYPDAINKLRSRPHATEHFAIWSQSLSDVPLDFAKSVTNAMFRGDIQHPPQYELDRIPAVILESYRENKRTQRSEMSEWELDADRASGTRIHDGKTHGMYKHILSLIDEAKKEQLDKHIADGKDARSWVCDKDAAVQTATVRFSQWCDAHEELDVRDAVRCLLCNDSGLVMCWSPGTMRDALEHPDSIRWTECGVPCTCNPHTDPSNDSMRINRWATRVTKVGKAKFVSEDVKRFDAGKHTPSRGTEAKDRLLLWAIRYREAQATGKFKQLGACSANHDEWHGEKVT